MFFGQSGYITITLVENLGVFHVTGINDVLPIDPDQQLQNIAVDHPIAKIMECQFDLIRELLWFVITQYLLKAGIAFPVQNIGNLVLNV